MFPTLDADGALSMAPYRIDEIHNEPWHVAKVEPGGGVRDPHASWAGSTSRFSATARSTCSTRGPWR